MLQSLKKGDTMSEIGEINMSNVHTKEDVAPRIDEATPAASEAVETKDLLAERLKIAEGVVDETLDGLDDDTKEAMLKALGEHLDEVPEDPETEEDKFTLIVEQERFSIWKLIMMIINLMLEEGELSGKRLATSLIEPPESGNTALADLLAEKDGENSREESWKKFTEDVGNIGEFSKDKKGDFIQAVMSAYENNSFTKVYLRKKGNDKKKGGFFSRLAGKLAGKKSRANLTLAA